MAKRYLSKEEKRNFIEWTKEHENGTLYTSNSIKELCDKFEYNPERIGTFFMLIGECLCLEHEKKEDCEFEIDIEEIPFVG